LKIAFVYFSSSGNTHQLVQAAINAVKENNIETFVYRIQGSDIIDGRFDNRNLLQVLDHCHAIVFASPTYMGGVAAQFKAFADATSETWCKQAWAGKIAAGITCGSAPNGDQTSTLNYFVTFASQHGMLWLGLANAYGYSDNSVNRLGCQLGVVASCETDSVHATDLATAKYLGKRLSKLIKNN